MLKLAICLIIKSSEYGKVATQGFNIRVNRIQTNISKPFASVISGCLFSPEVPAKKECLIYIMISAAACEAELYVVNLLHGEPDFCQVFQVT